MDISQFNLNSAKADGAEHFIVSPLSLLKMLIHARSGIPMEVMGLMVGEYTNSYTIKIIDVYAMPQSGTGTTVEALDPIFQIEYKKLIEKTNRYEEIVGWYHSHPGFGCWLSGTDCSTQSEFEKLNSRALAVVVDPVQSVKGVVMIEGFRTTGNMMMTESETTQVTSNETYLNKPSMAAVMHGLNRNYYTVRGEYYIDEDDRFILSILKRKSWYKKLQLKKFEKVEEIEYTEKVVEENRSKRNILNRQLSALNKNEERRKEYVEGIRNNLLVDIHKKILNF